ncbi:MAG TPA: DUF5683 domain-containing protein [Syntrophales bacterium]|nr:DUF5683 domain-containing protein [Syntrophales bacterium]
MKTALKAALLSGLAFPGTGQIYLKRYWRGFTIMVFVLSGVGAIVWMATMRALAILKQIQSQLDRVDMNTITNLALASSVNHTSVYYKPILLFILCCWIFSVIDAYRAGNACDRSEKTPKVEENAPWRK